MVGPFEVFAGASLLSEGGYDVALASIDERPVATGIGLEFMTTRLPDPSAPVDTVVLPGGGGVDAARDNVALMDWVKAAAGTARRVVTVCTGTFWPPKRGCSTVVGPPRIGPSPTGWLVSFRRRRRS